MQGIKEIAAQSQSAIATRSSQSLGQLKPSELPEIPLLMAQMKANYPWQDIPDETAMVWLQAWVKLAEQHGLVRFKVALEALQLQPGTKFFPIPSEISEALEAYAKTERQQYLKQNPFIPCGKAFGEGRCEFGQIWGDGPVYDCNCLRAWRNGKQPVEPDTKMAATGKKK